MPTISENRDRWQNHKRRRIVSRTVRRGNRGSLASQRVAACPSFSSHRHHPRIGPGFGRWTQYLRRLCIRLIVVDLSERCIDSCRRRFAGDRHIEYIVNDGTSLEQIPDGSVDFIFSFDSLVHAVSPESGSRVCGRRRSSKRADLGGSALCFWAAHEEHPAAAVRYCRLVVVRREADVTIRILTRE
jgi:hypothetical protein